MKTPDINSLVAGVLAIIGIAVGIGQYSRLEAWARHQAMDAMMWRRGLPHFFAPKSHGQHRRWGDRGASHNWAAGTAHFKQ